MIVIKSKAIGEDCRNDFLTIYEDAEQKQLDFAENVCSSMYKGFYEHDNTIHVVSARCGFGKGIVQKVFMNRILDSKYMFPEMIGRAIGKEKVAGMIYVTDRKSRLEDAYTYENIKEYCYWLQSQSDSGVPLSEQFVEQQQYPILMMTTQRYFQLGVSEIRALKKWYNQHGEQERTLVIFDEKPYFFNFYDLTGDVLNEVERELFKLPEEIEVITEETDNEETIIISKKEILASYASLKNDIFNEWSRLTDFLKGKGKNYTWIRAEEEESPSDFYEMIKDVDLPEAIKNKIRIIRHRKSNGCFYVNTAHDKKQDRYYEIPSDNLAKFLTDDFNYWIFDATAYNDMEYKLLANRLPFQFFAVDDQREEHCNAIQHIYNTSKNNMQYPEKAQPVIQYVEQIATDTLIITYKNFKPKIKKTVPTAKLMHFGDTKGYNEYKDLNQLLQIGVNRQDEFVYFSNYLMLYPEKLAEINSLSAEDVLTYIKDATSLLQNGQFKNEKMRELMLNRIATDFEQNIFRTKLRQFGSDDLIEVEVICSKVYHDILSSVLNRYGIELEINDQTFCVEPKKQKETQSDIIWNYLNSMPSGKEFTSQDLYEQLDSDKKKGKHKLDKVKEKKENGISEILTAWRVERNHYKKP